MGDFNIARAIDAERMNDTIETVGKAVRANETAVPRSIVDRLREFNLIYPAREKQIVNPNDMLEAKLSREQIRADKRDNPFLGEIKALIRPAVAISPQITEAIGTDLNNSYPVPVAVPGAEEKDINPDVYETFELREKEKEINNYYMTTVPLVATAGATALALMFLMKGSVKRINLYDYLRNSVL
jgi:hypothetical protein